MVLLAQTNNLDSKKDSELLRFVVIPPKHPPLNSHLYPSSPKSPSNTFSPPRNKLAPAPTAKTLNPPLTAISGDKMSKDFPQSASASVSLNSLAENFSESPASSARLITVFSKMLQAEAADRVSAMGKNFMLTQRFAQSMDYDTKDRDFLSIISFATMKCIAGLCAILSIWGAMGETKVSQGTQTKLLSTVFPGKKEQQLSLPN